MLLWKRWFIEGRFFKNLKMNLKNQFLFTTTTDYVTNNTNDIKNNKEQNNNT